MPARTQGCIRRAEGSTPFSTPGCKEGAEQDFTTVSRRVNISLANLKKAEGGEANIALAAKTPVVPISQLLKPPQISQLIENIYF